MVALLTAACGSGDPMDPPAEVQVTATFASATGDACRTPVDFGDSLRFDVSPPTIDGFDRGCTDPEWRDDAWRMDCVLLSAETWHWAFSGDWDAGTFRTEYAGCAELYDLTLLIQQQ